MITTAAKLWFAVFFLALVGAFVYGFAAGGEWFGSTVLGTVSVAALVLGVLAVALRDSVDTEAPMDEVVARSALPAGWPALGAVGAGVALIGLAGGNALLYVGIGIVGVTFLEWMVQAWAERATADPAFNQSLRDRIMSPFETPIVALVVIGFVLIAFSRILLAVDKEASTAIAIVVAAAIFGVGATVAARPRLGSSVLAGLLALGAVALLAAGIAGGVAGQRHFEHHGDEHAEEAEGDEAGNNPTADEGGEDQSDPGADPTGAPTDGESSDTGGDTESETDVDAEESTPASVP